MRNFLSFRPAAQQPSEKDDLARAFHTFVWLEAGAVTVLFAVLCAIDPSNFNRWLPVYVSMLAASFIGLWLNRHGDTRRAVIGFLIALWGVMTVFSLLYAAVAAPDSNRYVLIVVAAGLLLGKREGFVAAVICGLTEVSFVILINLGMIPPTPGQHTAPGLMVHLVVLALAALLPSLATRGVRNALSSAEEELDERRRSEAAVSENEARYLRLVDNSPDAIVIHYDGKFAHLNPASLELLRAESPASLLGKSVVEIVHPEYTELVATVPDQIQETKATSQIREGKMLRLDGAAADVETASIPVSFKGKPAIQTIVRDVTDIKKLQDQMRLQIAALNSAANGIVITDRGGTIMWVNAAFESLTGYSMAEAVGKNPRNLVKSGKQKAAFYREMWASILSGKPWRGELVNRRKDNTLYTEYMTITPVLDEHDVITNFVAVKQDITSQKLMEEQLLQAHKLEGIGQLAGGVAHDYNNILNVVLGYGELLKRKLGENDTARQPLEAIISAAKRGADLTRQLLAFARKEILSPKVIDINSAVDSIRNMIHRIIGENVKFVFVPAKDLWNVKIDPTQFDQILVNLASNSRDAIKDVGSITVRTSNVSARDGTVPSHPALKSGEYVRVTFEDDGRGMDDETLKHLFEPFFTTKPKGHGSGLGLSTIYGIIKQNGGAIDVRSEVGKGSTFEIYLPRFESETLESEKRHPDESLRGTETILIVEDQADVLDIAKTSLQEYGYNVMTSLDPEDAELLSEDYAGEIHLLLADIIMPKMRGTELSRRISEYRRRMKSLYMSGYGSDAFAGDEGHDVGIEFIQKPFTLQELASRVRQVLSK